jgi:hypothetical protein
MTDEIDRFLATELRRARPAPPASFADTIVGAALSERRQLRRRRFLTAGSLLAASVAVAFVLFARPWAPNGEEVAVSTPASTPTTAQLVQPVLPTTPSVREQVSEGRETLAAITHRAGEHALAPTRNLLQSPKLFAASNSAPTLPPELPNLRPETMEPLTGTTRRAVSLFVKDIRSLTNVPEKP